MSEHRKRRRRRRVQRSPIIAYLQPNQKLKGNVGVLSYDLYRELMGREGTTIERDHHDQEQIFVGIAPGALPNNSIEKGTWSIWPVKSRHVQKQDTTEATTFTLELPALSWGLQNWTQGLPANVWRNKITGNVSGFEISVVIVQPLSLDTIYVSVDGDAFRKHEEVQRRFGGGFSDNANGLNGKKKKVAKAMGNGLVNGAENKSSAASQDSELTIAIRQALSISIIIRQGDLLPLPLPAHPITHVPFPSAQIMLCEPIRQGLLAPSTKIVVNRVHQTLNIEAPSEKPLPILSSSKSLTDFDITDGDASSHEAFHSAVEEGATSDSDVEQMASDSDEFDEESGESSDDSSEDIIMMRTPSLAARPSEIVSSKTAVTPRATNRANGIHTPGSVFSNLTSATTRQAQINNGKRFNAHGLTHKIPDDILHPIPSPDDDEECRIFVNVKVLVRLGCFSGDWVQLKAEDEHHEQVYTLASAPSDQNKDYRPVKIYGIPDFLPISNARIRGSRPHTRRPSLQTSLGAANSTLNAWLSPVLLTNLGQPKSVRIRPLLDPDFERPISKSKASKRKINPTSLPPIAREMTLVKVPTPLSTEMSIQAGMFLALKRYFEVKRRILKLGDLVAIFFDANTSRLINQPGQTDEAEAEKLELMDLPLNESSGQIDSLGVVWFRVGSIVGPEPLEAADLEENVWSNATMIEMKKTRMLQSGSEQTKIPATSVNTWHYYLELRPNIGGHRSYEWATPTVSLAESYVSSLRRRLRELMAAATSPRALHLGLDPVIILLHSTQRKVGKATLSTRAASDLGLHTFSIDAYDLLGEGSGNGDVKSEGLLESRIERALSCGASFTSILLRHVEALTAERMVIAIKSHIQKVRVLIATTTEIDTLPEGIRSLFTHELEVAAPDEDERQSLLQDIIRERRLWIADDVDLAAVALRTAALVAGNLVDIVERALTAKQDRLERLLSSQRSPNRAHADYTIYDILVAGGEAVRCLIKADFDVAVEAARKNFADAIGAPKIPNVSWDDVGGLEHVKDAVMETIQLPLERPELFAKGMKKRSGILLYGPPGTGKTLLAKAIATEFSLNFFSIKGPELLNMYIGESEANVRRVFQRARDARPCVVFFDELDSVAPKRGNQGDSGGVMDRIVSQLLAELDGMNEGEETGGGVFVIGATNRPDLLDQALLRPGRFDKMLYLGVSETHTSQVTILEALTRNFNMHSDLSLRQVAELLPLTYTGADLYALCSDAMLKAITRQASAVDAKIKSLPGGPVTTAYFFDHLAQKDDIVVTVTENDFSAAQRELVPSVR